MSLPAPFSSPWNLSLAETDLQPKMDKKLAKIE
jgi:hypothetical protein